MDTTLATSQERQDAYKMQVFMTRHKTLQCVHEPFGDAYYFGPERLAERYENDPQARKESGYAESTYRTIFDRIAKENSEVRTRVSDLEHNILSFILSFVFDVESDQLPILILHHTSCYVTCVSNRFPMFDVCLWLHCASL
jgi:hypothetical protein